MKKFLIPAFIFLTIFFFGCILDDTHEKTESGEYLDYYFPLNPKLKRTYIVTSFADSIEYKSVMVRFFAGKKDIDGKTYYILQSQDSGKLSYYRIENDILYRYYGENEKHSVPWSHEEPLLDFTKTPGESWPVVSSILPGNEGETTYTLTATFHGTETVKTLRETFEDCARFDNNETWGYTSGGSDNGETQTAEMNYMAWYAKSIGLVKFIAEGEFFGDYTVELYKYTLSE